MYGSYFFNGSMEKNIGKILTIEKVFNSTYALKEEEEEWLWTDEMLEPVYELENVLEREIPIHFKNAEELKEFLFYMKENDYINKDETEIDHILDDFKISNGCLSFNKEKQINIYLESVTFMENEEFYEYSKLKEILEKGDYRQENEYVDENTEVNEMKILEIYKDRKMEEFKNNSIKEKEQLREKDELQKILNEFKDKISKLIDLNEIHFDFKMCTETTENAMENINVKYDKKEEEMFDLLDEVKAQLELADTYERKIEILKKYEILNEDGKING